jgi:hypothetical protein
MKKRLLPLFAYVLMVYSSQGQQAAPTPRNPAVSDSTEADNTKRNSSEQNKNTNTAEKQSSCAHSEDTASRDEGRLPVNER